MVTLGKEIFRGRLLGYLDWGWYGRVEMELVLLSEGDLSPEVCVRLLLRTADGISFAKSSESDSVSSGL